MENNLTDAQKAEFAKQDRTDGMKATLDVLSTFEGDDPLPTLDKNWTYTFGRGNAIRDLYMLMKENQGVATMIKEWAEVVKKYNSPQEEFTPT